MKKLILALSIAVISASASAVKTDAYVTDRFENLVRDSFGKCVRTGTWTPEKALETCGDTPPAAIKQAIESLPEQYDDFEKQVTEAPAQVQPLQPQVQIEERVLEPVKQLAPTLRVHFEFNKDTLSDADKKELDQYIDYLKTTTNEAHVKGWADRIGSDKYNMTLSTLRAITVTRYLIKAGVRVTDSRGMGESYTQTCPGKTTSWVKTCLAEDRFAEIAVVNTLADGPRGSASAPAQQEDRAPV